MLRKVFNPFNWVKLLSQTYGRIDLAADYYDKALFHGATFADLQRPDAPLIVINATDLGSGGRFPFIQEAFDLLCADLSDEKVDRLIAAARQVLRDSDEFQAFMKLSRGDN